MRLSQLTRRMDRGDELHVCLFGVPIDQNEIYAGKVRGIKRDDPINGMFVNHVCAIGNTIVVEVVKQEYGKGNPPQSSNV